MKKILLTSIFLAGLFINLSAQELFDAIIQRNYDKITEILDSDSSLVNQKNGRGYSAIHFAANFNQIDLAEVLKSYGADLGVKDNFGRNAVHWAASTNSSDMLKWLHENNVDIDLKDKEGRSPLYIASIRNADKALDFLIGKNVQTYYPNELGLDILFAALENGQSEVTTNYFKQDFDFSQKNNIGSNLLFAAAKGSPDKLAYLIEKQVDLNLKNNYGQKPVDFLMKNEEIKAVKLFVQNGLDLQAKDQLGKSLLDLATESGNEDLTTFFKELGVKSSMKAEEFTNTYPDIHEPGLKAELFGEGYISLPGTNERDVMFSPDMNEFYYSAMGRGQRTMSIHKMNKYDNYWEMPEIADFSGKFNEAECFITKNNQKLFFISQRSEDGSENPSTWEIWIADRDGKAWKNFHKIDTALKGCFYPTIANGNELIYTAANNDLYSAQINGEKISNIQKLPKEINTEEAEYNSMISPDGSFLIFTSFGQGEDFGGGDLYISFRDENGEWTKSINMGEEINSSFHEYCPSLSPDGKYFFFTSNRLGSEDLFWIDANIIKQLKSKSK
tara:strand:- start:1094 stop:2767 length:1674 start_codon:yes stop_codon:yes gene_type:complete